MFCPHCSVKASGNFCHSCGAMLHRRPVQEEAIPMAELAGDDDWAHEVCYTILLEYEDVRNRIAAAAGRHQQQMTGEEFLAACDALNPLCFSLEKLAAVLHPLYAKLGIKTGRAATERLAVPPGRVIVAALSSMAAQGVVLSQVDQAEDGCVLHGVIPSNIWSFAGELVVSVRRAEDHTVVEAAARIPGQLYDWGKGRRILDNLFRETSRYAA